MSHWAYLPVDAAAKSGRSLSLLADDGTPHSARWDSDIGGFAYGPGLPVQKPITHYLARLPGNPPSKEGTA